MRIAILLSVAFSGCVGVNGHLTPQGADESRVVLAVPLDRPYTFVTAPPGKNPRTAAAGAFLRAQVVSVLDGQTFTAIINERRETVRLIGVDAPDLKQVPIGRQAWDVLKALIDGRVVRLETDTTLRDGEQRILAYVYAGDLFVNLEMMKQGMGKVSGTITGTPHEKAFRSAEAQAKKEALGIWGPDYPPDDVPEKTDDPSKPPPAPRP
jgi:micrococcal nuclease